MRPLILASTSPFRKALLEDLGIEFTAVSPPYVESNSPEIPVKRLVEMQAIGKAESLGEQFPESLIVGADQVACLDGEVLTKPGTEERAVAQLKRLSGRRHKLLTCVAVHLPSAQKTLHEVVVHEMSMRALTSDEISAYVERESPVNCAGSYKIESLGLLLFDSVTGPDRTGIIGLPVPTLATLMGSLGEDLFSRALQG